MTIRLPHRGWLFDLDGTIYRGPHLIPGADATIAAKWAYQRSEYRRFFGRGYGRVVGMHAMPRQYFPLWTREMSVTSSQSEVVCFEVVQDWEKGRGAGVIGLSWELPGAAGRLMEELLRYAQDFAWRLRRRQNGSTSTCACASLTMTRFYDTLEQRKCKTKSSAQQSWCEADVRSIRSDAGLCGLVLAQEDKHRGLDASRHFPLWSRFLMRRGYRPSGLKSHNMCLPQR